MQSSCHVPLVFLSTNREVFFCTCCHTPVLDLHPITWQSWLSLLLETAHVGPPPFLLDLTKVPKAHFHPSPFLMKTKWNHQPTNQPKPPPTHTYLTLPLWIPIACRIKYSPPHGIQNLSMAPAHLPGCTCNSFPPCNTPAADVDRRPYPHVPPVFLLLWLCLACALVAPLHTAPPVPSPCPVCACLHRAPRPPPTQSNLIGPPSSTHSTYNATLFYFVFCCELLENTVCILRKHLLISHTAKYAGVPKRAM